MFKKCDIYIYIIIINSQFEEIDYYSSKDDFRFLDLFPMSLTLIFLKFSSFLFYLIFSLFFFFSTFNC